MDFDRLILAAAGNPEKIEQLTQAKLRHKYASKLPVTLRCEEFRFPDSLAAEQSTGDDIAEFHASLIEEGDTVLDMTCGLGIDAFHIARRASKVTACELKQHVASAASHNAAALGLANVTVVNTDSIEWLRNRTERFDVIFIDPARRSRTGGRVFALADCEPDVTAILPLLCQHAERVVIKASPMLDVSRTVDELGGDADILLIGSAGECKELVAVIPGSGQIKSVTIGHGEFTFTRAEENAAVVDFGLPAPGDFFYEPYPAVMKSGAMKLLAARFGLTKIAHDTHLYFGNRQTEFPGKTYVIEAIVPFDKRGIKQVAALTADGAEVAVRNFGGLKAEELRKRLNVKEGDRRRIYGFRDAGGKRFLAVAGKINA